MNDVSLKAKIRNIAKQKNLPAMVILQNYLFERFLLRLSMTEYKEKFVIKGGTLISSIIGLDNRTTMDLDTTLKNLPLNAESIQKAVLEICEKDIEDGIIFEYKGLSPIRDDDLYGGFKVSFTAHYGKINAPMSMDVSTGDVMTPGAELRQFSKMFESDTFSLWTYNIETVLGEKVETILSRNIYSTRPRDFYDVYAISKNCDYNKELFFKALNATAEHRGSVEAICDVKGLMNVMSNSKDLQKLWEKYRKQFVYAAEIEYNMIMTALEEILMGFEMNFQKKIG